MERFLIRGGSPASKAGSSANSTPKDNSPVNKTLKRKADSEIDGEKKKKFCDHDYDKTQRKREFQQKWKLQFPWVLYDTPDVCEKENSNGIMYCSTCREFPDLADKKSPFFTGTDSFRIDNLKAHDKNSYHIKCQIRKKGLEKTVIQKKSEIQQSPMGKSVVKMTEKSMDKFKVLFNSAYAVAKKAKPLTEYELLMEVQSKNGMDLGENYLTSKAAARFIESISDSIKQDIVGDMLKASYLCVLADGSTDSSTVEQEVILVRYIQDGKPATKMVAVEALQSGTAEGVKNGILCGLEKIGIDEEKLSCASFPSVVGVNFDGAAVMMGCKGGAAKLLEGSFGTHIIPIHCVAHKLELSVLDAVKKDSYLSKFEDTTKSVYRFYHKANNRRRELKAIAEALETDLLRYGEVKAIRWVSSKSRAIHAIRVNLQATVAHLEHAMSRKGSADEAGKAKKLLQEFTSVRFVKYLHFMEDYLSVITATSKIFQTKDLLLIEVPQTIEDTTSRLEALQSEPGDSSADFYKSYNSESNEFKPASAALPMKLKGPVPLSYTEDNDIKSLLQNSIHYLNERLKNFKEPPLIYFNVFDYTTWPSDDKLLTFGNDSISALTEHFLPVLEKDSVKKLKSQWITLKNFLKKVRNNELYDTYSNLLARNPDNMNQILKLVNIMMTLSPTTAECERQFSGKNNSLFYRKMGYVSSKASDQSAYLQSDLILCYLHDPDTSSIIHFYYTHSSCT